MRRMVRWGALALALGAALGVALPAAAEGPAAEGPAAKIAIAGRWTGAKLRCQKEEGKLVRCGTPAPFEITFEAGGAGRTPDESLPKAFTWRWIAEKEIGLLPAGGGEEVKLFGVESEEEGSLTFQAYIFLPTADPNQPAEARYIHFVFDVTRAP